MDDPSDLLSSLGPLAVETVSTLPSKSKVVSKFSRVVSAGLKARGDLAYMHATTLSKPKHDIGRRDFRYNGRGLSHIK